MSSWRKHTLPTALVCFFLYSSAWYFCYGVPKRFRSAISGSTCSHGKTERIQPQYPPSNSSLFDLGRGKPIGSNYSRTLVAGRLKDQEEPWIEEEFPDLATAIYVVDDPYAPYHVPANKGHEAMVYLTYIIDHYDNLADTTMFFHSHRYAWHINSLLGADNAQVIRHLSDDRVARLGYFNTNCHLDPGCPDWLHLDRPEVDWDFVRKGEEKIFTKQIWKEIFPSERIPPVVSQPCCAQFAVSRARIRLNPLSQYIHIREWLLKTPLEDEHSGRVMEYSWQYLFARQAQLCPRMNTCYCDGFGLCFGGADKLEAWLTKLKDRESSDNEIASRLQGGVEAGEDGEYWKHRSQELEFELEKEKEEAFARGDDIKNRKIEESSELSREI
ncbi:hypothetical protein MMC17_007985 [Xylographa soralifera]|nr:hypothetical protein [Xylographa soralifera]